MKPISLSLRYCGTLGFHLFTLVLFAQAQTNNPASLTWLRTGGPPGGLGYDIRYNYANPDMWYVTDSFAGLHISTDNGYTWYPSNNGVPPQAGLTGDLIPVFSVTVDPLNPQIVWIGTQNTGHIYKSTDAGQSWMQRDSGVSIKYSALSFRGFTVHPRSSDTVYAMGETTSHVPRPDETGGVVYRTTNGGDQWEIIWEGGMPSSLARYMFIDPRNPNVLYVSTGIFDRGAIGQGDSTNPFGGLGILKSTDGGVTWREFDESNGLTLPHIGSLYMNPHNPDVLLAAAGHLLDEVTGDFVGQLIAAGKPHPSGVYRTTDGGESWTQVLSASSDRVEEAFTAVELSEFDPSIGYAGSQMAMYRTQDSGKTWTLLTGGQAGWGGPGIQAGYPIDIQCDPRDANRLFVNNYGGGNLLSTDGGETWQNASQGYTGAISGCVALDPGNPSLIYVTARSGIWSSSDGGTHWIGLLYPPPELPFTECTAIQVDPIRPNHLLVGCWPGAVLESEDGGRSWEVRYRADKDSTQVDAWLQTYSTFTFAPSDPSVVYGSVTWRGAAYLHEPGILSLSVMSSHDGGKTWQHATDNNIEGLCVFDIAVDPTDAGIVYAASETGLFKTTNSGASWTLLGGGLPVATRVRAVGVDPRVPDVILAGVEGMGVYSSTDAGGTWVPSNVGLEPNGSLHDIVYDPADSMVLYTSDALSGVYRSTDAGHTWLKMNTGLRNRAALGLGISADGQHLYVATNGQGVFRLDLSELPVDVTSSDMLPDTYGLDQNFPNPFNPGTTIRFNLPVRSHVTLKLFDVLGREMTTLVNETLEKGSHSINLSPVDLSSGVYFYQVRAGAFVATRKMMLMR